MLSDISLTDLRVELTPGSGDVPFIPAVHQFSAGLSAAALGKIVQAGIAMVQSRLPVDVQYAGSQLSNTGAEVTARVKRSVLKADIRAQFELSTPTPNAIRVRFANISGPAWVPAGMVIDKAIEKAVAQPGVTRATDDPRAVDVDPKAIMAAFQLPVVLAEPGAWTVNPTPESINVAFSAGSGAQ